MLTFEKIKRQVIQQRVAYLWEIYTRHGLVDGDAPPCTEEKKVSALFDGHPEGIQPAFEVRRDVEALEKLVAGKRYPLTKRPLGRKYVMNIKNGTLDCAMMALEGILTPQVHAAFRKVSKQQQPTLTPNKLADLLGVGHHTANRRRAADTIFGYPIIQGTIAKDYTKIMVADLCDHLLCSELVPYWHAKLQEQGHGIAINQVRSKMRSLRDKTADLQTDDPYARMPKWKNLLAIGEYAAFALRDVHAITNIFYRDMRLLNTHITTKDAAKVLGVGPTRMRQKYRGRYTSLLDPSGAKSMLYCTHDLHSYANIRKKNPYTRNQDATSGDDARRLVTSILQPHLGVVPLYLVHRIMDQGRVTRQIKSRSGYFYTEFGGKFCATQMLAYMQKEIIPKIEQL